MIEPAETTIAYTMIILNQINGEMQVNLPRRGASCIYNKKHNIIIAFGGSDSNYGPRERSLIEIYVIGNDIGI